jgi:hypothetical protein
MNIIAAVVIPVYKVTPSFEEEISFKQCIKILNNYKICIACPNDLDVSYYLTLYHEIEIYRFDKNYFQNIEGYNKLLLTESFYFKFIEYKYILLYQLDSFVFRDELSYWCSCNYDYIGAPWINTNLYNWLFIKAYPKILINYHKILFKGRYLKRVGNGGFSLRKVNSFISNLKFFRTAANNWQANEDSFFAHFIGTFNPFFKIPNIHAALQFSFDAYPLYAFQMNNNIIPFGCHAFNKSNDFYQQNKDFWKSYIKELNDELA